MRTVRSGGQSEAESSSGKQEKEEARWSVHMQLPGESQRLGQVTPVEKCGVRGGTAARRGRWVRCRVGSLVRMSEEKGAVRLNNTSLICGAQPCPGDRHDTGGKEGSGPYKKRNRVLVFRFFNIKKKWLNLWTPRSFRAFLLLSHFSPAPLQKQHNHG